MRRKLASWNSYVDDGEIRTYEICATEDPDTVLKYSMSSESIKRLDEDTLEGILEGLQNSVDEEVERQKVNLREVVSEITSLEGLGKSVGVGQVSEIIGLLGIRWRRMSESEFLDEVTCIRERAGKRSAHKRNKNDEQA